MDRKKAVSLVGLGKMGFNLGLNLHRKGIVVAAYDISPEAIELVRDHGVNGCESIEELARFFPGRKIIWLMVPSGIVVDETISLLVPHLSEGDIIIDGGNSHYKDSIMRSQELALKGIHFLDCGTSGGTSGALNGICAMIGGDKEAFEYCEEIFSAISVENGYLYCGPSGSGHFAKMVHNGIEYGMMQSIAEGFELLERSGFNYDHARLAQLFNNGSVIRGWLMELTQKAFEADPGLESIRGIMHSSGEGKWMLETALEKELATPVIALSLLMRYRSMQEDTFSGKVVAALRHQFGGHSVETK